MPEHCRVVDARYLAPEIPAETPPRFAVGDGRAGDPGQRPRARAVLPQPVRRRRARARPPPTPCVWLLGSGVDPDAICWVRPREPWMLNRALIQPDPEIYLAMVADMMQAAGSATSLDQLFLRLEELGIMLRIDRTRTPTMAKSPTLGLWELERLRSIENVVRRGHLGLGGPGHPDVRRRLGRRRRRRARRELRGRRAEEPAARADLGTGRRSPCSRSAPASPASAPRSPATSRRRATTTPRRTGCARRRRTATA